MLALLQITVSGRRGEYRACWRDADRRVSGNGHFDPQLPQPLHQPIHDGHRPTALQVVGPELVIGRAPGHDVVGDDQQPVGDRHDGPLRAAPGSDTLILRRECHSSRYSAR
ncbi:MAG TPA: hypothetical protein VLA19_30030 [Herpetosiphonaceae bacterium]|nr:hypothetical protein [Herpetosiphonaceae bacterium]